MRIRLKGINTVQCKLASGVVETYYYHRSTGTRLKGRPGTPEFVASIAAAEAKIENRTKGTLSGLFREFEATLKWRRLADSTRKEYKRVLTFWDERYGTCSYAALEDKAFRRDVLKWHDAFSEDKPREADNRVTILARVLSWGAKGGPLKANVLDSFDRAYAGDRSDMIWLPEHVDGCNLGEIVSITGHSLRRAQEILDKYLARTSTMADNAIAKFENVLETDFAKRAAKRQV